MDFKEYYLFLRDRSCDVSTFLGLTSYMIGLLNLNMFSAQTFILCSYVGTFLIVGGLLAKMGVLTADMSSKQALTFILVFTSAVLFTTSAIVPFIDINVLVRVNRVALVVSDNAQVPNAMGNQVYTPHHLSNVRMTTNMPYAWLAQPLILIGAVLLVITFIIQYID